MKYLIVDDEPISHQIIEKHAQNLPFLSLAGNCYDAISALDFLRKTSVDLLFLDVSMPKLTGFDFLRTLKHPPSVVVVSAHPEYALESYDLNVCDYLLKPFPFERFLRAVNKAREQHEEEMESTLPERHESLFFKDGKKHHQISLDEILYVEAQANYCMVHLVAGSLLASEKISELAKRLPAVFLRVHKSYIVATRKIQLIEGDTIQIGGQEIPIGRAYKANVVELLEKSS